MPRAVFAMTVCLLPLGAILNRAQEPVKLCAQVTADIPGHVGKSVTFYAVERSMNDQQAAGGGAISISECTDAQGKGGDFKNGGAFAFDWAAAKHEGDVEELTVWRVTGVVQKGLAIDVELLIPGGGSDRIRRTVPFLVDVVVSKP